MITGLAAAEGLIRATSHSRAKFDSLTAPLQQPSDAGLDSRCAELEDRYKLCSVSLPATCHHGAPSLPSSLATPTLHLAEHHRHFSRLPCGRRCQAFHNHNSQLLEERAKLRLEVASLQAVAERNGRPGGLPSPLSSATSLPRQPERPVGSAQVWP